MKNVQLTQFWDNSSKIDCFLQSAYSFREWLLTGRIETMRVSGASILLLIVRTGCEVSVLLETNSALLPHKIWSLVDVKTFI